MIFKEFRGVKQTDIFEKLNFREIGPAYAPEIEISKKYWISFPEIGLCQAPENWNFVKISGWVSRAWQQENKKGLHVLWIQLF